MPHPVETDLSGLVPWMSLALACFGKGCWLGYALARSLALFLWRSLVSALSCEIVCDFRLNIFLRNESLVCKLPYS